MDTFYKTMLLFIIAIHSNWLCAQEVASKKIEKTYAMTNAGELYLDNKYGDIIINGWDKNTIKIVTNINVKHKKKENAKSLLDRIDILIKNSNDFVHVSSEIADKNTGFFAKYFNKANPFDYDKSNIQINYEIYLPSNAVIDVNNKFGDIIFDDYKGKLKANLQHGDMWINEDLVNVSIDMKFGKLHAKSILYGSLKLKNGELDLEHSDNLRISSSGTTMKINKVTLLELYSSKDKITIEEIDKINGEVKFSNININSLAQEIKLTMNLADLKVNAITNSNAVVSIHQESSEINIAIANMAFQFKANLEQGLLRIPKSFKNINNNVIDKGKKIREITASYGNNPSGRFTIQGKKGIIILND